MWDISSLLAILQRMHRGELGNLNRDQQYQEDPEETRLVIAKADYCRNSPMMPRVCPEEVAVSPLAWIKGFS